MKLSLQNVLILLSLSTAAQATSIITTPSGLNPGDTYRLIFVTSGTITGSDPNISTYDTFVTSAANAISGLAALNATWEAIVTTNDGTVASTHVGTFTDNLYNLAGTEVAAGSAGLFSGTILSPVLITETGATSNNFVWAGSVAGGTGFFPLGASRPDYGWASASNVAWLQDNRASNSNSYSVYAISSDITVPGAATPEAGTMWLFGGSLIAIGLTKFNSRSRA